MTTSVLWNLDLSPTVAHIWFVLGLVVSSGTPVTGFVSFSLDGRQ